MPHMIKDGTGSGSLTKVTSDNYLQTNGHAQSFSLHAAHSAQDYYGVSMQGTATVPSAIIGYIKNTDDKDMIIDFFTVYSTAATQLFTSIGGSGTPSGGSDVVARNVVAGSGKTANGTFQQGNLISGLTGTNIVLVTITPADETKVYDYMPLIIPKNQILTYSSLQTSAQVTVGTGFYYHDPI